MHPNNETATLDPNTYIVPGEGLIQKSGITLSELRASLVQRKEELGKTKQQGKNMMTALNRMVKFAARTDEDLADNVFGTAFDNLLNEHLLVLTKDGYSESSIRDRLSLLLKIREHFDEMICHEEIPTGFADCLRWAIRKAGLRPCDAIRAVKVDDGTFSHWIAGRGHPTTKMRPIIVELEKLLTLEPGTLISRSGIDLRESLKGVQAGNHNTDYARRIRLGQNNPYALIHPTEALRVEWKNYIRHKTASILRPGEKRNSAWRVKPRERITQRLGWAAEAGGNHICVTADIAWNYLGNYLGYLSHPELSGALSVPLESLSLAYVSDCERVIAYLEFLRARSGVYSNATYSLVSHIAQMLRPETGFLWQNGQFAAKLSEELHFAMGYEPTLSTMEKSQAWQNWCESNRQRLYDAYNQLADQQLIKPARDPKRPIQTILSRKRPLDALREMVARMEKALSAINQPTQRKAFIRDLLLIKMLCANPLRIHNYAIMTWRPDNAGNLYQTESGDWRIQFNPEDFKNQRGAAKKPYDVGVSRHLWADIENYLSEIRPHLQGAQESDYMFRPTKVNAYSKMADPSLPWATDAMSSRIQALTRVFVPGCSGFGPHAFRHIVATDYLKNNPRDYMTVAYILHDTLKTVMDNYGHMTTDDGFSHYTQYYDQLFDPVQ